MQEKVQELFKEPKLAAHKAHKAITEAERTLLGPILTAKSIINEKCIGFLDRQRALALEEERKRNMEATIKAAAALEADAKRAEQEGQKELAEEIRAAEPVPLPIARVEANIAQVPGIGTRVTWSGEVIGYPGTMQGFRALVEFVAQNPEYLHLLEPATSEINALARAQREALKIPGVRAVRFEGMGRR